MVLFVCSRREIVELTFENGLFETNLERKKSEPVTFTAPAATSAAVNSSQATTPTGSYQDLSATGATSRNDRLARKRSKSRSTQGDFRIQLTMEQKLDIITTEYEQMKNEKTRRETAGEKKIDQLEVRLSRSFERFDMSHSSFLVRCRMDRRRTGRFRTGHHRLPEEQRCFSGQTNEQVNRREDRSLFPRTTERPRISDQ